MPSEIPERSEIVIEVNLTTRLNRVLSLAMDEACRRKLRSTNTALILLAMLYREAVEGDGVGVQILKHLGVPLDHLVTEIRAYIGDQSQNNEFKDTKLALPAIQALELAVDEARGHPDHKQLMEAKRLSRNKVLISTGHLLLGIIQVKNEPIAAILDSCGITLGGAREAVKKVLA